MSTSKTPARVLVVEDEFLISHMLCETLIEHGFQVDAFRSADGALRHLDAGHACDILLTDINLGHQSLDGMTLARLVRQRRSGLPVVYASGSYSKLEEVDAVDGAVFVAKPYDPERLCAKIHAITTAALQARRVA